MHWSNANILLLHFSFASGMAAILVEFKVSTWLGPPPILDLDSLKTYNKAHQSSVTQICLTNSAGKRRHQSLSVLSIIKLGQEIERQTPKISQPAGRPVITRPQQPWNPWWWGGGWKRSSQFQLRSWHGFLDTYNRRGTTVWQCVTVYISNPPTLCPKNVKMLGWMGNFWNVVELWLGDAAMPKVRLSSFLDSIGLKRVGASWPTMEQNRSLVCMKDYKAITTSPKCLGQMAAMSRVTTSTKARFYFFFFEKSVPSFSTLRIWILS